MPKRKQLSIQSADLLDSWGRRNRKYPDKPCSRCGLMFRPKDAQSKYCSRACLWSGNGKWQKRRDIVWYNMPGAGGYICGHIWRSGRRFPYKSHRFVMEQHIGRLLEPWEQIHHLNGNKTNNRIENLEILNPGIHSQVSNAKKEMQKMRTELEKCEQINAEIYRRYALRESSWYAKLASKQPLRED